MSWPWLHSLFSPDGFITPTQGGGWSPLLILATKAANYSMAFSLFILAGLLLWLACLRSTRGSQALARQRLITMLFSAVLFWNGCAYLVRAVIFAIPLYRLQITATAVAAIFSWATVWVLFPAVLGIYYQHRSSSDVGPTDQIHDLKVSLLQREVERAEILEGLESQRASKGGDDDRSS